MLFNKTGVSERETPVNEMTTWDMVGYKSLHSLALVNKRVSLSLANVRLSLDREYSVLLKSMLK